jgi:hypothetical protein
MLDAYIPKQPEEALGRRCLHRQCRSRSFLEE